MIYQFYYVFPHTHYFLFFLNCFFNLKFYLFWPHWVLVAARGLSLVAASRGYSLHCSASHCGGFSCCRARALGAQASVVVAHGL